MAYDYDLFVIGGGSGGVGSCTWGVLRDLGNILRLRVVTAEAKPHSAASATSRAPSSPPSARASAVLWVEPGTHEVSRIAPGMAVEVQVEGVDKTVAGRVARIARQSAAPNCGQDSGTYSPPSRASPVIIASPKVKTGAVPLVEI